jgi:hypothetical protein
MYNILIVLRFRVFFQKKYKGGENLENSNLDGILERCKDGNSRLRRRCDTKNNKLSRPKN